MTTLKKRTTSGDWITDARDLIKAWFGVEYPREAVEMMADPNFKSGDINFVELVAFAMEGERVASQKPHADNVAPAIYGGFTLVRGYEPLDIVEIGFPEDLYVTVAHPQVEVKTSDAKKIACPF